MPNDLKITIPVKDGNGLNEQKLDALFQQLEEFVNNIKLNGDNLQTNSVTFDKFQQPIIDETFLVFDGSISVASSSLTSVKIAEIGSVSKLQDRRVNTGHFPDKLVTVTPGAAVQDRYVATQVTGTIAELDGETRLSFSPAASVIITAKQRPLLITVVPTGDSASPGYIEFDFSWSSNEEFNFRVLTEWYINDETTGRGISWLEADVDNFTSSGASILQTNTTAARVRLPSIPPILIRRSTSDSDEELTIELKATVLNSNGTTSIASDCVISLVNMQIVCTEI